jgi:hypothetical protein
MMAMTSFGVLADDEKGSGLLDDSVRDMTTVFASGAAGAVLGLSTLSFVDTPSDHLKNISVGGAIGIVIGVSIVVFNQAGKSVLTKNTPAIRENSALDFSRELVAKSSFEKSKSQFFNAPTFNTTFSF